MASPEADETEVFTRQASESSGSQLNAESLRSLEDVNRAPTNHDRNFSNMSMSNYGTMVAEEKDQYIEKLRRRNRRAKEKIQQLEDSNADFWKTIQQQQDILEAMEKNLDEQKAQFKKELQALRSRKNRDIVKLKNLLLAEREGKGKEAEGAKEEPPEDPPDSELRELDSLRMDNGRLEDMVDSLTKEVESLKTGDDAGKAKLEVIQEAPPDSAAEIEELKTSLSGKDEQIKALQQSLEAERTSSANLLAEKTAEHEEEYNKLKDQLSAMTAELKLTSSTLDEAAKSSGNVEKLSSENQRLQSQLQESQEEQQRLKEQLDAEMTRGAEQGGKEQDLLDQLEAERDKTESLRAELETTMAAQQSQVETLEKAQTNLESDHAAEKKELSDQVEALGEDLDWVKASKVNTINALNEELQRLSKMLRESGVVNTPTRIDKEWPP